MKYHFKLLLLSQIFSVLMGCASHKHQPISSEEISLKTISSKQAILTADVYRENDLLVVEGIVKRRPNAALVTGHVEIHVVDPNGKTVKTYQTYMNPPRLVKGSLSVARFRQEMNDEYQPGITLRVEMHLTPH